MMNSTSAIGRSDVGSGLPDGEPAEGLRVVSRAIECVTTSRFQITDVTSLVASAISESGVRNGIVHVQSLHTTTSLFLNERQEALLHDFEALLSLLVDEERDWRHNDPRHSDCDRGNAAAHLRSLLLGHSLSLQIQNGRALLGKWQTVLFAELDGPRTRSLSMQLMGV